MNFDDKDKNLEQDDLQIRKHLDTSLDKEGIYVSEELKNKTLDLIKADEKKSSRNQSLMRARRFMVSVAAAIVFIVVGAGLTSIFITGSKSLDDYSSNENMEMERSADAPSEADSLDMDKELAVTEDEAAEKKDYVNPTDVALLNESLEVDFREIVSILPGDIDFIKITNVDSEIEVSLTKAEKIDKFYETMGQYKYRRIETSNTDGADSGLLESNYIILINGKSDVLTINVGEKLILEYQSQDERTSETYVIPNREELNQNLNDLIEEYK